MCSKADIARYEIIYRFGGMYIDADTLWLENEFDYKNFFKKSLNLSYENENLILNTWFVGVKNHQFLKLVIDEIKHRTINKDPAWMTVGPKLLTDVYNKLENKSKFDINFVDLSLVLCPKSWHGINTSTYNSKLDNCKNEKKALAFHYGISTNNL